MKKEMGILKQSLDHKILPMGIKIIYTNIL